MDRREFIGNLGALLAVGTSVKELSLINKESVIPIPIGAVSGDILINNLNNMVYYFSGDEIINILDASKKAKCKSSKSSDYVLLSSSFKER